MTYINPEFILNEGDEEPQTRVTEDISEEKSNDKNIVIIILIVLGDIAILAAMIILVIYLRKKHLNKYKKINELKNRIKTK